MSYHKQTNLLAIYHNIIDCGFKENQTQVIKIAIYNAKYGEIDVSYFVKLLCESSDLSYAC